MQTSIYLTEKLRLVTTNIFKHWCTGCNTSHDIDIFKESHRCWDFNGSIDYPTFRPSMKVYSGDQIICHYNLVEGVIHYLGDSLHEMSGKSIALANLPEHSF